MIWIKQIAIAACISFFLASHLTKYISNSDVVWQFVSQKTVLSKARPILEDTIKDMFSTALPTCFKLADLGCFSGPNTLLFVSEIMDVVYELCQQQNCKLPGISGVSEWPSREWFQYCFQVAAIFLRQVWKRKGRLVWTALFHIRSTWFFLSQALPKQEIAFLSFL